MPEGGLSVSAMPYRTPRFRESRSLASARPPARAWQLFMHEPACAYTPNDGLAKGYYAKLVVMPEGIREAHGGSLHPASWARPYGRRCRLSFKFPDRAA